MSHYFETGAFSNGEPAWHGLGIVLPEGEFLTPENVLEKAGLGWQVEKTQLLLPNGTPAKGMFALTRSDNGAILNSASVGDSYEAEQSEALVALMTALAGEGVKLETALSLKGGSIVTLLGKMEAHMILGDAFIPFLSVCDYRGGGSRACYMTDIREVCWNTHSLSIGDAKREKRVWKRRHSRNSLALTETALKEAREILKLSAEHTGQMTALAEDLALVKMHRPEWVRLAEHLFPMPSEEPTKNQRLVVEEKRSLLFRAASAEDLANFRHTAWGALSAVTNFASHVSFGVIDGPQQTKPQVLKARQEDRFLASIEGSELEKKALDFLLQLA